MNKYIVYKHICPNKKVYIGITQQEPQIRWNYGNGYKSCVLFYKAIKKYGWNNIEHDILYTGLNKEEAEQKEKELILLYESNNTKYGYNICSGGNGTPNHIVNEKTKKLISDKTKQAMNNQNVREKIRKAHLGKKLSEEQKHKISISCTKPKTKEQKQKLKDVNKNKLPVICVETQIIYESIHEASRITKIAYQNIYKVCKGKRKTAGGYSWKYGN